MNNYDYGDLEFPRTEKYDHAKIAAFRMNSWVSEGKIKPEDRVFVKPYNCMGTVVRVTWLEELKFTPDFAIPEGWVYIVELDGKDWKPRGFSYTCLKQKNGYS